MRNRFESYKLTEFNSLFEIPVYRLDPASFEEELQKTLDKICLPLEEFEDLFPKNGQAKYNAHRHEHELHIGYPWKFNEIVGWVLLNIDEKLLSGDLFYKDARRITKASSSKIVYKSEAFRFNIEDDMTDHDIYDRILTELKALSKKPITIGRYIDVNRFETVGKYITWRQMFADLV